LAAAKRACELLPPMPSLTRPSTSAMRRATAVLLALLLAAHAPMLLNDGLFMDDWLVLKPRPDFMIDIDFLLRGAGHPIFFSGDAAQGLIQRTWRAAWYCVTRYPELAVLPLVYWGALNIWFKRTGVYAQHYNAHFPTLSELARGWQVFFVTSYWDVVATAFRM